MSECEPPIVGLLFIVAVVSASLGVMATCIVISGKENKNSETKD